MSVARPRRGRPFGRARQVATDTGVHIRTVQRIISKAPAKTPEERRAERFVVTLRNFATFCRENTPADVGKMIVTSDQAKKCGQRAALVRGWLDELYHV